MPRSEPVRVLIVDDSALMRKVLSDLLTGDSRVAVAGIARDGYEAVRMTTELKPDVITLDVEMPGLSGLDTIPLLLEAHEAPIVMVSAFTQEGAEITLEALDRGAVDFMAKPDRNQLAQMRGLRELLVGKVLTAASSRVAKPRKLVSTTRPPVEAPKRPEPAARPSTSATTCCVVLGISTGGPQTLTRVFRLLRPPVPPIVVVQHMPAQFTPVLAERLNRVGGVAVKHAEDGDRVLADQILIAPGGRHLTVNGRVGQSRVSLNDDPPVSGHRPSVDVLFKSAARVFGAAAVGVIMTGMGRDGVEGCRAILEAGGSTYGQDEATSIVYGMNKAAFDDGVVGSQLDPEGVAEVIRRLGEGKKV